MYSEELFTINGLKTRLNYIIAHSREYTFIVLFANYSMGVQTEDLHMWIS